MRDGRSIPREVLEHYRFRALKLRKKGWNVNEIAASFGVHRGSVSRWLTKYKRSGKKSLRRRKAHGAKPKLSKADILKVFSFLKKPASEFGFENDLWDCRRMQQVIKKKCGKSLDISNVWRMLRAWNFSPQKPEKRAIEQNDKAVKKWLKEEWPKILAHAGRWQAIIYFQDECGVSLIPVMGRTWAKKGQTPTVKITGSRGGICVTSAISRAGRMIFRIEKEKIKAKQHIEFLQQILKRHPYRKIIVIEDQARPHIAKAVEQFIQKNKRRFARYFIPPYSPELNPDEKTWRHLKKHNLKSHLATTTKELKTLVLSKMKSIQRKPKLIRTFFYNSYVT